MRWCKFALLMLALVPPQLALASSCDEDMADAHKRIAAIQARDPKIDRLFKRGDIKGVCAILRSNVADMTSARDDMQRCLFERNENVANLNAHLADLRDAIAARCK